MHKLPEGWTWLYKVAYGCGMKRQTVPVILLCAAPTESVKLYCGAKFYAPEMHIVDVFSHAAIQKGRGFLPWFGTTMYNSFEYNLRWHFDRGRLPFKCGRVYSNHGETRTRLVEGIFAFKTAKDCWDFEDRMSTQTLALAQAWEKEHGTL